MKPNRILMKVVIPLLAAFLILACGGATLAATATPAPTDTPTQKPTNTPRPTNTPLPTPTKIPPTPTAVPMGTPVSNGDYEVNIVYMRTLDTVYLDTMYHWVPTKGNMFVELGVIVSNSNPGSKINVRWGDVSIQESNGSV